MKRILAFLIVAVLSLSLCACQSDLDPKYQAVIDQLENGNYQNAIDLIENMATLDKGENDENNNGGNAGDTVVEDSNKQPELTQEQIAWKEKVVGNWFADAKQTYKRPDQIIEMLVDIIAKNGTMLPPTILQETV